MHALRALLADGSIDSLKAARKLGAAPLLEGFDALGAFDEWVAAERRTLRRDLAAAARSSPRSAATPATDGEDSEALELAPHARAAAGGAHRELMACYARAGRYTEALRQYQLLRTVLRRELDLAPDPATEALYRDLMKKRRAAPAAGRCTRCPAPSPRTKSHPRSPPTRRRTSPSTIA